jgi:hypothetical protein
MAPVVLTVVAVRAMTVVSQVAVVAVLEAVAST